MNGDTTPEEIKRRLAETASAGADLPRNVASGALALIEQLEADLAAERQKLANRKLIERAKGIIMKASSLDEAAAFHRLQRMASSKNKKLHEMAETVIDAAQALSLQ